MYHISADILFGDKVIENHYSTFEVMEKEITGKINPVVKSSTDTGVALTKTENGETLLLITDYSKYDQSNTDIPKRREICFNTDDFADAEYINVCNDNAEIGRYKKDGILKGITVMLRPHETMIFKMVKK